jgi:hypothetical protein
LKHAIEQAWFPIPSRRRARGLWPIIFAQFKERRLHAFGLLPSLDLLAAQFAKALPIESL